ncbi:hypothetical protein [Leptodesmis sp.]|uniref:hypothetical protein n=1 Tax=Leptodesmis sp. TaxID=3100501 RepID=UPI00405356D4
MGLDDTAIQQSQRSIATMTYERSFVDDFGYGAENFYPALASLSGRELCVSIRNQRILRDYFDVHGLPHPTWLALHAELEIAHFLDYIRPGIVHAIQNEAQMASLKQAIAQGIDRHIRYFDDLLTEYAAAIARHEISTASSLTAPNSAPSLAEFLLMVSHVNPTNPA